MKRFKVNVLSAASSCSAPSLDDSEVPSCVAMSVGLAPLSCCDFSMSVPDVAGLDKATFASSAIVGRNGRGVMEMVGENSVRMRVTTRF